MGKGKPPHRSVVLLVAYSETGEEVEHAEVSFDDYYEGTPPLIDDDNYRSGRRIRRITGKIFDSAGKLQCDFENFYGQMGESEGGRVHDEGRVIHQDGTVIDD